MIAISSKTGVAARQKAQINALSSLPGAMFASLSSSLSFSDSVFFICLKGGFPDPQTGLGFGNQLALRLSNKVHGLASLAASFNEVLGILFEILCPTF